MYMSRGLWFRESRVVRKSCLAFIEYLHGIPFCFHSPPLRVPTPAYFFAASGEGSRREIDAAFSSPRHAHELKCASENTADEFDAARVGGAQPLRRRSRLAHEDVHSRRTTQAKVSFLLCHVRTTIVNDLFLFFFAEREILPRPPVAPRPAPPSPPASTDGRTRCYARRSYRRATSSTRATATTTSASTAAAAASTPPPAT